MLPPRRPLNSRRLASPSGRVPCRPASSSNSGAPWGSPGDRRVLLAFACGAAVPVARGKSDVGRAGVPELRVGEKAIYDDTTRQSARDRDGSRGLGSDGDARWAAAVGDEGPATKTQTQTSTEPLFRNRGVFLATVCYRASVPSDKLPRTCSWAMRGGVPQAGPSVMTLLPPPCLLGCPLGLALVKSRCARLLGAAYRAAWTPHQPLWDSAQSPAASISGEVPFSCAAQHQAQTREHVGGRTGSCASPVSGPSLHLSSRTKCSARRNQGPRSPRSETTRAPYYCK